MNKKGFSLVEALLVIAIIGVLLLTLIPSVITIINENKRKTCISTKNSIINAAKMYVAENKYNVISCGDNTVTLDTLKSYGNLADKTLDERARKYVQKNRSVVQFWLESCDEK